MRWSRSQFHLGRRRRRDLSLVVAAVRHLSLPRTLIGFAVFGVVEALIARPLLMAGHPGESPGLDWWLRSGTLTGLIVGACVLVPLRFLGLPAPLRRCVAWARVAERPGRQRRLRRWTDRWAAWLLGGLTGLTLLLDAATLLRALPLLAGALLFGIFVWVTARLGLRLEEIVAGRVASDASRSGRAGQSWTR